MMTEGEILKARDFCKFVKESTGHDLGENNPALPLLMILHDLNRKFIHDLTRQNDLFLEATKVDVEDKVEKVSAALDSTFSAINKKTAEKLVHVLLVERQKDFQVIKAQSAEIEKASKSLTASIVSSFNRANKKNIAFLAILLVLLQVVTAFGLYVLLKP